MATFHGMFGSKKKQTSSTFSSNIETAEVIDNGNTIIIPAGQQDDSQPQTGQLAVDILEYATHYEVKAPIAGISIEDLDIDVEKNTLTIAGRRSTNLFKRMYFNAKNS